MVARLTGADPAKVRAVARTGASPADLPPARDLVAALAEALGVEGAEHGFADAPELEAPSRCRADDENGGMRLALLHALPLDERMWEPQLPALGEHDVVAPSLYGLGTTMDEWADSVLRRLEGDAVAVGASMGGYCALALARRAPERVRGLVLAGARADADSPERQSARNESIERVRSGGAEALWEELRPRLFPPGAEPGIVERARRIALEQAPADLERAIAAVRDRPDARDLVRSLPVPLLVLVGESDPFLPVEEARALAESAPRGRLVVFDGAGHLPSLEQPAAFNAALREFLAALE